MIVSHDLGLGSCEGKGPIMGRPSDPLNRVFGERGPHQTLIYR